MEAPADMEQYATQQRICTERCECCGEVFEIHNMGDHPEFGLCCFKCLDELRKENGISEEDEDRKYCGGN